MSHRLGHRKRGEPPLMRALGIAEGPQGHQLISQGPHGRVRYENLWPAVALRVIQDPHPSGVRQRTRVPSGVPASEASGDFGEQTEVVAPELCCEVEKLPGNLGCGLQIWLNQMIEPQPHEAAKELGGLAGARTQFLGSGVGGLRLDRSVPLCGNERGAEREAELDLPRDPLGRFGERVDQLEALGQMGDRIGVGRGGHRPLRGAAIIVDGESGEPGGGVVVCDQFRLGLDHFRELAFERLGDPGVERSPALAQ